jgi:hypothetical protein
MIKKQKFLAVLMILIMILGMPAPALPSLFAQEHGNIIYVKHDATGAGNGSTWADAYTTLQAGLDAAHSGDQIWVARGTYYPTSRYGMSGTNRNFHFRMKNGVAICGGFAGNESPHYDLTLRDFESNETILSGDIGTVGDNSDNCYHVFYHPFGLNLSASAVLDGFTITAGNANHLATYYSGGGMHNKRDNNLTLRNIVFSDNRAYSCGGMANESAAPTLYNVTFKNNTAYGYVGGGMGSFNTAATNAHPTLTNVIFTGNFAKEIGGGMWNHRCSPSLTNVSFTSNQVATQGVTWGYGGGIYNGENSNPALDTVNFQGNTARFGGGMFNEDNSSPLLSNVFFTNNTAFDGGGMYNDNSNPTLINAVFSGNTSSVSGGGIANYEGSTTDITNAVFYNNTASGFGGGIYNVTGSLTITNCTFSMNHAGVNGGGLANLDCQTIIRNCIIWGNTANGSGAQMYTYYDAGVFIDHSLIQGCGGSGGGWAGAPSYEFDEGNNIDTDPLFVDAADGNLRLQAGSPAINAGNNNAVPTGVTTDLDGNPRIVGGTVDMGAYEYQGGATPALAITTASLPDGTVGSPYSATLAATGGSGTYSWSAAGLPAGLGMSSGGVISGTPTTSGTSSVTVTVNDGIGSVSKTFNLTVRAASSGSGSETDPGPAPQPPAGELVKKPEPPAAAPPVAGEKIVIELVIGSKKALVNGREVMMDVAPFIKTQAKRTMIPVRFVSEQLGAVVQWLPEKRQVKISRGATVILLTVDSAASQVNGKAEQLDCPPEILEGRTFVPLRFVGETLGATVHWDRVTRTIIIEK